VRTGRWLAAGAFAFVALRCSAPQTLPAPVDTDDFAGVAYPAPQGAQPGPAQPPPHPQRDLPYPSGLPPTQPVEKDVFSESLRNAALRDDAQLRLARDYHRVVELLLRASPGKGGSAEAYDSVPVYRLHDEMAVEWHALSVRAAALEARWVALAEGFGVDLSGGFEATDRDSRLRLHQRFARCVDSDARARTEHASTWNKLRAEGKSAAEVAASPPPAVQYARDVQMMARAMQCARFALQVIRAM